MVLKDVRARTITDKGKDQGRRNVRYRGLDGHSVQAVVLAQGSVSGLKLLVPGGVGMTSLSPAPGGTQQVGHRIVDNVPLATGMKQTNVYFSHTSQN